MQEVVLTAFTRLLVIELILCVCAYVCHFRLSTKFSLFLYNNVCVCVCMCVCVCVCVHVDMLVCEETFYKFS